MSEVNADVLKMFTGVLEEKAAVLNYTPPAIADLTWEDVKRMSGDQLKEIRKHVGGAEKIDQILAERAAAKGVKVDEAIAAEQAAAQAAEDAAAEVPAEVPAEPAATVPTPEEEAAKAAETARIAAEAEQTRIAAEAAVKVLQEAEAKTPKRYVFEYQVRDNDGNPVGNKTHLEASSAEELEEKKQESYRQAVLAIDRLKKQKPTFRQPEPIAATQAELDEAATNLVSEDPKVRAAAVTKLASAATAAERAKTRLAEINAEQAKESYTFLRSHIGDYNNCEANNNILAKFLEDNNLEWTAQNLDIALGNVEKQLAPVIRREAAVPVPDPPPANPAQVAQPVATATAVPAAAPAATVAPAAPAPAAPAPVAPAAPAAPAANPPAAPAKRPGVNAGLVPGSTLHGVAPAAKTAAQTRTELIKELKGMSAEEMKRRHKLDPKFYEKVNAALAKK